MRVRVNGELWGEDTSAHMHHTFADMIAYASRSQTLHPGEVLGSGTAPAARGWSSAAWLAPGDVVELEIEGIGVLRNTHRNQGRHLTMAYVVCAKWTAKEGSRTGCWRISEEMTEPSRAEPGNRFYQAHRSPEDPRLFFLYEQYADEAGYEAHMASEHFTRLVKEEAIPELLEVREREFYETLATRGARVGRTSSRSRRPVERALEVLLDVERVAPCLPGAALTGGDGETYDGTMTIKIGPITTRFEGTVRIEEADEAARRAVMRAQARDSRGPGHGGGHDHVVDGAGRGRHARAGGDRHAGHRPRGAVRARRDAGREREADGPLRRLPGRGDGRRPAPPAAEEAGGAAAGRRSRRARRRRPAPGPWAR